MDRVAVTQNLLIERCHVVTSSWFAQHPDNEKSKWELQAEQARDALGIIPKNYSDWIYELTKKIAGGANPKDAALTIPRDFRLNSEQQSEGTYLNTSDFQTSQATSSLDQREKSACDLLNREKTELKTKIRTIAIISCGFALLIYVISEYFYNHPTFEEIYLNQQSQKGDVTIIVGAILVIGLAAWIVYMAQRAHEIEGKLQNMRVVNAQKDQSRALDQMAAKIGEAVASNSSQRNATPFEAEVSSDIDPLDKSTSDLKRLVELLDKGLISESEFLTLKNSSK